MVKKSSDEKYEFEVVEVNHCSSTGANDGSVVLRAPMNDELCHECKTLAESFEKYPKVFDNVFIALIRAGESSGTLDEALNRAHIRSGN